MVVLVKDDGGKGEVVVVFEELWEALQAAQSLDSPYSIYVKSFEHTPKEVNK